MDTFLDIALDDELRTSFQVIDRNNDTEAQRQILGSPYYRDRHHRWRGAAGQGRPHGLQHPLAELTGCGKSRSCRWKTRSTA